MTATMARSGFPLPEVFDLDLAQAPMGKHIVSVARRVVQSLKVVEYVVRRITCRMFLRCRGVCWSL